MQLTSYQTASDFLLQTQDCLQVNEAANNLILGILFRLRERPDQFEKEPYLVTVTDAAGVALAAMMTPPFNLVLYSDRPDTRLQCELLTQDLLAGGWSPPGVMAPSVLSKTFAESWSQQTGQSYRAGMRQRVFELRRVVYFGSASGQLLPAGSADLRLVTDWLHHFTQEALDEDDLAGMAELARRHIAAETLYLWHDQGQPVSMAAKTRQTRHGATVSLVYTPPAWRKRGYATACVAHLSQLLLDSGWQFCSLFTDLANPTSNAIYHKIGYQPRGDFDIYLFQTEPG